MKLKTKDQSEDKKMPVDSFKAAGFYLPAVLVVTLVLIFSAVFFKYLFSEKTETETVPVAQVSGDDKNKTNNNTPFNADAIQITTDKNEYAPGEQISLHIENLSNSTIYAEPCKDIKVFEGKEGDSWALKQEDNIVTAYQYADFEKKEGDAECNIELPKWGPGTYRVVVPIYFNCAKPSLYACEWSKVFRSNEFKIDVALDAGNDK